MKKEHILYSANFKSDYIATSAKVIFFLIVIIEITLAFSIPAYLRRENSMALQVQRLNLLQDFDRTRNICSRLKIKSETTELERRLIEWNLNSMADYLRLGSPYFTSQEISELSKSIKDMARYTLKLQQGGSFSQEKKLDTSLYLKELIDMINSREKIKHDTKK